MTFATPLQGRVLRGDFKYFRGRVLRERGVKYFRGRGNMPYVLESRYPTHFLISYSFPDKSICIEFTYGSHMGIYTWVIGGYMVRRSQWDST